MLDVVLFDLDGVLRHFDADHSASIERACNLAPGTFATTAFAAPLIDLVTTGAITRAQWVDEIGRRIGDHRAAAAWGMHPSTVDHRMLKLSDHLRRNGIRTAILTNGTDTVDAELRAAGVAALVDAVFNSADIGFAKPDVRAFAHVLDALGVAPECVLFVDDSAANMAGAGALGMRTHHFTEYDGLCAALADAGVPYGLP